MKLRHPMGPHHDVIQVEGGEVCKYDVLMIGQGEQAEFVWVDGTPLGDYVHVRRFTWSVRGPKDHRDGERVVLAGIAEEQ